MTSKADRLRDIDLFRRCSENDLVALAAIVDDLTVLPGFVLCDQGRVADDCYVVDEGEADVIIGGEIVTTVGPGDPVGEMALLDHLPRSATVVATTPMKLYVISAARFEDILASTAIARGLLEHLSLRVRELEVGRRTLI